MLVSVCMCHVLRPPAPRCFSTPSLCAYVSCNFMCYSIRYTWRTTCVLGNGGPSRQGDYHFPPNGASGRTHILYTCIIRCIIRLPCIPQYKPLVYTWQVCTRVYYTRVYWPGHTRSQIPVRRSQRGMRRILRALHACVRVGRRATDSARPADATAAHATTAHATAPMRLRSMRQRPCDCGPCNRARASETRAPPRQPTRARMRAGPSPPL